MSNEIVSNDFAAFQAVINDAMAKQNRMLYQEIQAISDKQDKQNINIEQINHKIDAFDENLPLFGVECDRITSIVKSKGVSCLGGKAATAYKDNSLRGQVYSDIYHELKREFGVSSFKAIKRNQVELAVGVIEAYQLPLALEDQIRERNQAS